jgi:hypothetical protein
VLEEAAGFFSFICMGSSTFVNNHVVESGQSDIGRTIKIRLTFMQIVFQLLCANVTAMGTRMGASWEYYYKVGVLKLSPGPF